MKFIDGGYVSLGKLPDGNLIIILNSLGWQNREYILKSRFQFETLLEAFSYDPLWLMGTLDELGALSEAPYITNDFVIDYNTPVGFEIEDGYHPEVKVDSLWYYPSYQVYNPVEELYKSGYVVFKQHKEFQA